MKTIVAILLLITVCLSGCAGNFPASTDNISDENQYNTNIISSESQDIDGIPLGETGLFAQGEYYRIYKLSDTSYCHYIYNAEKQLAYRSYSYTSPSISLGAGNVLEIRYGAGTGAWLCEYFDIITSTLSDSYFGAYHIKDQYIAYMLEEDGMLKLQITDAFIPEQYDYKKELDFFKSIVFYPDLKGVSYIDATHLNIEYLNTNAEIVQVVIEIPELKERSSNFMQDDGGN